MLKKVITSFKDSYEELRYKTTWPSRSELTHSAIVVLTASIVIALMVFAADTIIETVMKLIYGA
jgi:preprotein translocase subunit SecE